MTTLPPQDEDDLQGCMSSQPRRQPKPKPLPPLRRSDWTPPLQRKEPRKSREIFEGFPRWLGVAGGITGVIVYALFLLPGQNLGQRTLENRGPVSEENLINFPPPDLVQEQPSGGRTPVLMTNGSPETMRIKLVGPDGAEQTFAIEPCQGCGYTDDVTIGEIYCDRGPQQTIYVPPGQHRAFVSFQRIESFRSDWLLVPDWQYQQCIFGGNPDWGQQKTAPVW